MVTKLNFRPYEIDKKLLTATAALLLGVTTAVAQQPGTGTDLGKQPIPSVGNKPIPGKPKAPSGVAIYFSYDISSGTAEFQFPSQDEGYSVTLENQQTGTTYYN